MPIKYVLFDFDGTIADTNEIVNLCLQITAKHGMNRELSDEEMDKLFGKPLHDQCAYFDENRVDELVEFYRKNYKERRDVMTSLFPGIYTLLEKLKSKGYRMAIVSNKNSAGIAHGLQLLNIGDFFDAWISSEDVDNKKPHPEGVFRALSKLTSVDLNSIDDELINQTVLIGDSIHDMECGKNAGCKTILVEWTSINIQKILEVGPDLVAETPEDIFNYVCEYI